MNTRVVNQHPSQFFSKIHKITHLNMRSKMEQIFFACDHSNKKSYVRLHRIYLERKGVGKSELDSRADTFKTIYRHELVDTN